MLHSGGSYDQSEEKQSCQALQLGYDRSFLKIESGSSWAGTGTGTGIPAGYTGITVYPAGYTGIPAGYDGIPAGYTGISAEYTRIPTGYTGIRAR